MPRRTRLALAVVAAIAPVASPADASAPHHHVVNLQAVNGPYVVAEQGGGGVVNANRKVASVWERFVLVDLNGGALEDGDSIQLRTYNGKYVTVEGGENGVVRANRDKGLAWEIFRVERVAGKGKIESGDAIAIRSAFGRYFVAEGGGGGVLNANRTARGPWETFKLSIQSSTAIDPSPLSAPPAPTAPPTSTTQPAPTTPPTSTTQPAPTTTSSYIPPEPNGGIPERLSQSDIMAVVVANKPAIVQCVNEQKKKDPGLTGKLVMRWTIQTNGMTKAVSVLSTELQKTYMASCITGLVKGWTFKKHKKQGDPVTFPFTF